MSATAVSQTHTHLADETLIGAIVDVLYDKMLDDYRVNRFFSSRPVAEQTGPLKVYLNAALAGRNNTESELLELLDDYFMAGFARTNAKRSLVSGNDFAFLLDIVGGREIRTITLLCDAHSHLIKLGPDDFHYDIAMEHLADSLKALELTDDVVDRILVMAESARGGVLGRGSEKRKAA
jgi:hemoglobin